MRSRNKAGKTVNMNNFWRHRFNQLIKRQKNKGIPVKRLTRQQKDYEMYVTNQYNVCRFIWPGVTE